MSGDALMVVLSNANPGREADFNRWYSDIHLVEVVDTLAGFESGRRYRLADMQVEEGANYRYLAIYRIRNGQLKEAQEAVLASRDERSKALAEGRAPEVALDTDMFDGPHRVWFFEAITDEYASTSTR
jgi:hypothetical protein